jgi:hypothetical protein
VRQFVKGGMQTSAHRVDLSDPFADATKERTTVIA